MISLIVRQDSDTALIPKESDAAPIQDAEKDRASERQLKQHLNAFFILTNEDHSAPLSEKLIKDAHSILMKNLQRDGDEIHSGDYREIQVNANGHTFIHFSKVASSMETMVKNYNQRFKVNHNSLELASWLLMETLKIHPFEDGNGRISRLLWCYSLMREGLPFPVTPFPDTKKA